MRRGRGMEQKNEERKEEWEQKRIVINKSKRRMYTHIHISISAVPPKSISTLF